MKRFASKASNNINFFVHFHSALNEEQRRLLATIHGAAAVVDLYFGLALLAGVAIQ